MLKITVHKRSHYKMLIIKSDVTSADSSFLNVLTVSALFMSIGNLFQQELP